MEGPVTDLTTAVAALTHRQELEELFARCEAVELYQPGYYSPRRIEKAPELAAFSFEVLMEHSHPKLLTFTCAKDTSQLTIDGANKTVIYSLFAFLPHRGVLIGRKISDIDKPRRKR